MLAARSGRFGAPGLVAPPCLPVWQQPAATYPRGACKAHWDQLSPLDAAQMPKHPLSLAPWGSGAGSAPCQPPTAWQQLLSVSCSGRSIPAFYNSVTLPCPVPALCPACLPWSSPGGPCPGRAGEEGAAEVRRCRACPTCTAA